MAGPVKPRLDAAGNHLREGDYVICGDPSSGASVSYGRITSFGIRNIWVQTVYRDAEQADGEWRDGRHILTKPRNVIAIPWKALAMGAFNILKQPPVQEVP